MAIQSSYITVGIREDLVDKLVRTGDGEAMFLSSLQKRSTVSAKARLHEWQDWALAAAADNAQTEAFTPATASVARNRRSNNVQIFAKAFQVADSALEGIDIAGIKSEYQFQADAAFTGLRRDIEYAFWNRTGTISGGAATAARLAGPLAVATTNMVAPAATTSVFTETEFISVQQKIFSQRGVFLEHQVHAEALNVTRIMGFTGPQTSSKVIQVMPDTTVHNRQVSVIVTNFGKMTIIPNNLLAGIGKMLYADMNTWALAVKVPPKLKALAKTTDSTAAYWKTELTLEFLNQSANGQLSGIATA